LSQLKATKPQIAIGYGGIAELRQNETFIRQASTIKIEETDEAIILDLVNDTLFYFKRIVNSNEDIVFDLDHNNACIAWPKSN
jgi:hypothetical protein